jgi:hypothetical protein
MRTLVGVNRKSIGDTLTINIAGLLQVRLGCRLESSSYEVTTFDIAKVCKNFKINEGILGPKYTYYI